jgi:uncharacterized membrane protein
MTERADEYIPVAIAERLGRQAGQVWLGAVLIVLAWVLAIVIAPIAAVSGVSGLSAPLYQFFSLICHQLPERSFHVSGEHFAVCSRCFGVYFGLLLGLLIYPLWRKIDDVEPLPRFWLFLSLIPIGVDWSLGVFGIWENTHLSRSLTGVILGVACATYIMPAIVEIARNTFLNRQIKKAA